MKDLPEIRVRSGNVWAKLYFSEISIWGGQIEIRFLSPRNFVFGFA
jgi:hypothetical protein